MKGHYFSAAEESSILTDRLIDIASSESDTSGDELNYEVGQRSHTGTSHSPTRMNTERAGQNSHSCRSSTPSPSFSSASCSSSSHRRDNLKEEDRSQRESFAEEAAAEIDIDHQVKVFPDSQSKWSFSGGSVLGLITNNDNDYSLWLRVKEKKRLASANNSFFSSTLFSFFSPDKEESSKYSFDEILTADEVKPNTPSSSHSLLISKNNRNNLDNHHKKLPKNSKKSVKDSTKNNRKEDMKDIMKVKTSEGFVSKSEIQKLTTNINLNDDDEDELLSLKDNEHICDWSLYKGIFYALLSSLFFSLSCVIVKYLKNIHPGQLAVARYVGVLVLSIPLVVYHRQSPFGPPEMRHLLVLRGICGATALFLRFYAFRYLPIADASVIVFSIPIFVSIFGHFFLNEPCGLFQTFIVILAMIGLMLSTKIPFLFGDPVLSGNIVSAGKNFTVVGEVEELISKMNPIDKNSHILGVSAGLASLIFASAVYVFIRKAKGVHYSVIMIWFGAVAIIETTLLTLFLHGFSMPQTAFEWRLIGFLAVFAFLGQILLTRALQLEHAGSVSVARSTSDISFGFLWQISIFSELPDGYSISGAILVSSCIFLITLKNWVNSLPEHSRMRRRLRFVTL